MDPEQLPVSKDVKFEDVLTQGEAMGLFTRLLDKELTPDQYREELRKAARLKGFPEEAYFKEMGVRLGKALETLHSLINRN